jgi:hypothetical protein
LLLLLLLLLVLVLVLVLPLASLWFSRGCDATVASASLTLPAA